MKTLKVSRRSRKAASALSVLPMSRGATISASCLAAILIHLLAMAAFAAGFHDGKPNGVCTDCHAFERSYPEEPEKTAAIKIGGGGPTCLDCHPYTTRNRHEAQNRIVRTDVKRTFAGCLSVRAALRAEEEGGNQVQEVAARGQMQMGRH